ncbi:LysR family transcriptional regulator [Undibacter mobilis]|uniref:LysR family transcriptional regulator n=1 Tax=Undibacter mobilis TaxID=2292256 RepID=A0A371BDG0_9BRAD|nr:LysR family transcriptional regulator [Undibacter mobilis]RDV05646.1 LysR family transcriptional regulator [Undibacter mobilis]
MTFDGRLLSGIGVVAAVVQSGSFVGAASVLGMTQSGVSRAVARLEQRVGARLFERHARAVVLTDEGRRFFERAAPLFAELDEAVNDVGRAATAVRGALRVSVNPLVLRMVLADQLSAFLAQYSDLSLSIAAQDVASDLVADGFDVAVRFGEPERPGHIVRRLTDTRVVTCASPVYLKRHGRPTHPRELAAHECIHYVDAGSGRPFAWEFHRKGRVEKVTVKGRLTLDDGETMLTLCEQGHGIAQVLEFAAPGLRKGKLVDLFPDWNGEHFPLYVEFPSRRQQPAKVRAFVDFVADVMKQA